MGVVYEAEQVSVGRRVALKILPFAALLNRNQLERFNTEATAAARLQHPGIVQVYSVGCERGIHFYCHAVDRRAEPGRSDCRNAAGANILLTRRGSGHGCCKQGPTFLHVTRTVGTIER